MSSPPSSQPTASLCPVCLARLDARRVLRGPAVYLEKACPEHGFFATRIWDGEPAFTGWQRPKIPTRPPHCARPVDKGCPFDCGLCPDHRQRSCTIILEVTQRCNLACPVCYADAGRRDSTDPSLDTIAEWYAAARRAGTGSNIQLSGGEPTLRDDLPGIVSMGREAGFGFIQINTNGLRLARDPAFVRGLKAAGLSSVFLQFDGTDDAIYRKLRGRDLLEDKLAAIEACGASPAWGRTGAYPRARGQRSGYRQHSQAGRGTLSDGACGPLPAGQLFRPFPPSSCG